MLVTVTSYTPTFLQSSVQSAGPCSRRRNRLRLGRVGPGFSGSGKPGTLRDKLGVLQFYFKPPLKLGEPGLTLPMRRRLITELSFTKVVVVSYIMTSSTGREQ